MRQLIGIGNLARAEDSGNAAASILQDDKSGEFHQLLSRERRILGFRYQLSAV